MPFRIYRVNKLAPPVNDVHKITERKLLRIGYAQMRRIEAIVVQKGRTVDTLMVFSLVMSLIFALTLILLICDVTRFLTRYMSRTWIMILVPSVTVAFVELVALTGTPYTMGYIALFGMCYAIASMPLRRAPRSSEPE